MKNPTKTEMVQVIVQALFNIAELPSADHFQVQRRKNKYSKQQLETFYKKALVIIASYNAEQRGEVDRPEALIKALELAN